MEDQNFVEQRLNLRSRPSLLSMLAMTAVNLVQSGDDTFTRLGEIFARSRTAELDLDGSKVHVCCHSSTLAFVEALGTMRPFCTVEHVVVWTNGEWYMKIPFGVDEAVATREVSERTDVVEFGADMCITTGEHRGKRLLATRAAGQRAGDVYDRLEELDGSTKKALIIALQRIHDAGWHHHNLHAANTVILDGKVSIIDFGRAQRTSESECTDNCHDYDVSTSINISPSSSTPGTADDEIMN